MAPSVMLAQLIQALYNIIDSVFVGRYSETGLTALSIVYPLQLLMIALAVGTGVGINTLMSARLGAGDPEKAEEYAGIGTPLAVLLWALFAGICYAIMPLYAGMQTDSPEVIADVISYGRIVCVFSFGLFLESIWTKILQARGDMKTPMSAQIVGAVTNIVLDPILIFGIGTWNGLGIAGAGAATVLGQCAAALIVMKRGFHRPPQIACFLPDVCRIFRAGIPNILMQSAYTLYIFGLNLILASFSDAAVTVLGLYYKWQTFFFIPLGAMQTCIVPVISYNYAAHQLDRCRKTMYTAIWFGIAFMSVGILCFELFPEPLLRVFTEDPLVIEIGRTAFRIIGCSFIPIVTALIFPVFLQAVGEGAKSAMLTVIRTVICFVPLGYLFSRLGLHWFWMTFPVTEIITTAAGILLYKKFLQNPYRKEHIQ